MKQESLRLGFFLPLLIGVLVIIFFILSPYLVTLTIAATITVIVYPLYEKLLSVYGKRARLAAISVIVLTYLLVLIPLVLIGIQVGKEAAEVYTYVKNNSGSLLPTDVFASIEGTIQRYIPWATVDIDFNTYAKQALGVLASNLQTLFTGTVQAVLLIFLGTLAYYYMLKDGKQFLKIFLELIPLKEQDEQKLVHRLHDAVNSVIRGSLIIALLQGLVTGIGLLVFGVPNPSLLGVLAGIGALIPTVGTAIVLTPVVLYLLITGDYFAGIGLTIWGTLAVGMIDNFLHPLLVGRGMKMHPLFIFFAVLGGIAYFGISGFIVGPIMMSLLFGLLDIYRKELKN